MLDKMKKYSNNQSDRTKIKRQKKKKTTGIERLF
jgi:hypothetical protein